MSVLPSLLLAWVFILGVFGGCVGLVGDYNVFGFFESARRCGFGFGFLDEGNVV